MKRSLLFSVVAVLLFLAVAPAAQADQTFEYWAWQSRSDGSIYCGPWWPQLPWYYDYVQVGGKTIYCDLTESTWGDTSCDRDIRPGDATPCY